MQNIQVICEKILSGVSTLNTKPTGQVESVFLDILASMSSEAEVMNQEVVSEEETVIEDESVDVLTTVVSPEVMRLWMAQMPQIPINTDILSTESVPNEVPVIQLDPKQENQVIDIELNENKNTEVEVQTKEFKLVETTKVFIKEAVVLESVEKNEIETHYKVLSHSVKSKDITKSEESIPMNQIMHKEFEIKNQTEVKLNDLEMSQFKQSIEEMKTTINQMSQKEDQTIVFKLKPEGLAEIVIKFEQKLGKVVLDISTSNRMVEQMIQKELPHLRDSLKSYQMEVNLNEMNFKNHSDHSEKPKYYQERQVFKRVEEESVEDDWVFKPQMLGFNTYV